MRVLVLTPWYPTPDHPIAGIFVLEYARAVLSRCEVTVLHCGVADPGLSGWRAMDREPDEAIVGGIPCYRARFRPSPVRGGSFLRRTASTAWALHRLLREQGRPDLIHAHVYSTGWAALLAGRRHGIPVVISEHYSGFLSPDLPLGKEWEARGVMGMADAVLPVSRTLQRALERHGIRGEFQVVPNIVDTDLFSFRPEGRASDGTLRLLAAGALLPSKGFELLLRALARVSWNHRPWRLDLLGDGPEAERLQSLVDTLELADHVTFHGWVPKKQVAEMMDRADLFVHPSRFETFSVVTAEALCAGVPVVVTRCGGPEELVTERSGMLVPVDDPMALAEALSEMIDRLPGYDREAISREACERFSGERVGAMLCDLYERLVAQRQRRNA